MNYYKVARTIYTLAIAIAIWSCHKKTIDDNLTDKTFVLSDTMMSRIHLDTVKMENVISILRLNGKVAADESKMVEVFPFVGGNVMSVDVELGDYVQKGQVLAVIKSGEVADFDRQLIDAENDVLVAQNNLKVQTDLYDSKLTSEKEYFAAQKEVSKAEAGLNRIKEVFKIYSIKGSSEYIVHAPISGFVIEKNITRDMTIRSDKSDNLFTIAQTNEVFINANVYETDISKVSVGMPVEINLISYPDTKWSGKIDRILSVLDPVTKTMRVRIRIPNADYKLKPEMAATVKVIHYGQDQMLAVPSSAVVFDNNKSYVIIFKDKRNIETREVSLDHITDDITYLSSGVKIGEVVVSKNQLFIYDALND
jgi:cobalt-zinc-cadmium efflux system membrane fusion protein